MAARRPRKAAPSRARSQRPKSRSPRKAAAPASNGARTRVRVVRPAKRSGVGRKDEFTRLLLEERRRLRAELTEMEEHQVKTEEKPIADVSGYEDDLVDVATETFEREKELAISSNVQGMLEMVEEALERLRNGTFGICVGCRKPIDGNRLRVIPYTRLCIKCKEREERQRVVVR
jgi:RNA polymerase-binding transcription factor DksA